MDRRLIRWAVGMISLALIVFGGSLLSVLGLGTVSGWMMLIIGLCGVIGVVLDWAFIDTSISVAPRGLSGQFDATHPSQYPKSGSSPSGPVKRKWNAIYRFNIYPPQEELIGRKKDLTRLEKALRRKNRIIVIAGEPGSGKTSLARALAKQVSELFPHAMLELDLNGNAQAIDGPLTCEDAMHCLLRPFYPEQKLPTDSAELTSLYQNTFHKQQALLFLDNAVDDGLIQSLLPPEPSAAIITTTNPELLNKEKRFLCSLHGLSKNDGATVLIKNCERLKRISKKELFPLVQDGAGLPFLLKILAGFLSYHTTWSPQDLSGYWHERWNSLTSQEGNQSRPIGELALQITFDDLDDLLKERFRMLAVFPAPFSAEATQAVWGTSSREAQLLRDELAVRGLIDSLARARAYSIQSQTRVFAFKLLKDYSHEFSQVIERHAFYYLNKGAMTEQLYNAGGEELANALVTYERDWPHYRAALAHMTSNGEKYPLPDTAPTWLANLPAMLPNFLRLYFSAPKSRQLILERSVNACQIIGNQHLLGSALYALGQMYMEMGDPTMGIGCVEQALDIHRNLVDELAEIDDLAFLSNAYAALGQTEKAQQLDHERKGILS